MDCDDEAGVCSGNPPAIVARGPDGEGWIVGTRAYVWQVVQAAERHGSSQAVARATGLSEHQVRVALEFYERSPEPIDAQLAAARAAGT